MSRNTPQAPTPTPTHAPRRNRWDAQFDAGNITWDDNDMPVAR